MGLGQTRASEETLDLSGSRRERAGPLARRRAHGGAGQGGVCIFHPQQMLGPRGCVTLEGHLHFFIHPLTLAIRPRVET